MVNKIIYFTIILFCILRPIFTLRYFVDHTLFEVKIIEFYGLSFSYIFLILIFVLYKRIRLDFISIAFVMFSGYLILSTLWGSAIRDIVRLIVPFTIFFIVWIASFEVAQAKNILKYLIYGFLLPVVGSTILISLGFSGDKIIYHTGLVRYSGLYNGSHSIAHSMFLFIWFIRLKRTWLHEWP